MLGLVKMVSSGAGNGRRQVTCMWIEFDAHTEYANAVFHMLARNLQALLLPLTLLNPTDYIEVCKPMDCMPLVCIVCLAQSWHLYF